MIKRWSAFFILLVACGGALRGATAAEIEEQLREGDYADAVRDSTRAVRESPENEELQLLHVRSLMAVGNYMEANAALTNAVRVIPMSIRLKWLGRETNRSVGRLDLAQKMVTDMTTQIRARPGNYSSPVNLVAYGRLALHLEVDAREVLDRIYAAAQRAEPKTRDLYLAKGELALEKHDFAVAAQAYRDGLRHFPDDPDFHYGLARAFEPSDRPQMLKSLEAALKVNPRHVPSLLLMTDHLINAEDYEQATKLLTSAREVDAQRPESWAYSAIIAHLRNDPIGERTARENGLKPWAANPVVDYLIGKKLAERYRFTEGAAYQRQALKFDPDYLPAKAELAVDLLRLGEDVEGYALVKEIADKDAYDVQAYNLITLQETMAKYATLRTEHFIVKMPKLDAEIYGQRTLDLLTRARAEMVRKYGMEIASPTYVEIFGDQKDFAVRTFGMPDVAGFLGVCFGRVVTANGPGANAARPANWEAVLWHEFTHVITLQMTRNKMPRWLSEGISVHEESLVSPAWGMPMTPRYRDMILQDKALTPVGKLSGAFMAPPSAEHLQFAYFQSAMVVNFLVEKYGTEPLKLILQDIGRGIEINDAIAARTAPLPTIEREFEAYAKAKAEALAPGLKWDRPDDRLIARANVLELAEWAANNQDNYWALFLQSRYFIETKKWADAKVSLTKLVELYPRQSGPDNANRLLATVHRELGETELERAALVRLADQSEDAADAYLRLMELASAAGDWAEVEKYADRYLAVNPLVIAPHRYLAKATYELNKVPASIAAHRTMLKLDPPNPVDVHYNLARLLKDSDTAQARRHVIMALEDAPRFRDAYELLRQLPAPTQ